MRTGLLVTTSLSSSTLIMHFGLISSVFGLITIIIAALAGGFFSGFLVSRVVCNKKSPWQFSWQIPLAGGITALVPIIFIVCAFNMHDEFPDNSFCNKMLGQYHDKISPLHE